MKGKLFTLCSVLLLAASCSTDDYAAPGTAAPDGQIRFEISFAPRDGAMQTHSPATRVETDTKFNSTWQDGDAIGIFMVANATTDIALRAANRQFATAPVSLRFNHCLSKLTMKCKLDPQHGQRRPHRHDSHHQGHEHRRRLHPANG